MFVYIRILRNARQRTKTLVSARSRDATASSWVGRLVVVVVVVGSVRWRRRSPPSYSKEKTARKRDETKDIKREACVRRRDSGYSPGPPRVLGEKSIRRGKEENIIH